MMPGSLVETIGLRFAPEQLEAVRAARQDIGFFEVDAEDYMGDGGPYRSRLAELRATCDLSVHSGGLAIGALVPLDRAYLAQLAALCDGCQPALVSEHLAWASPGIAGSAARIRPYSRLTLDLAVEHVQAVQLRLGRRLLIETPVTCAEPCGGALDEGPFLRGLAEGAGCGLLLDLGNVYVTARALGRDPLEHLRTLPLDHVGEIHLPAAGSPVLTCSLTRLAAPDIEIMRALYGWVVHTAGPIPTILDWEGTLPAFEVLSAGRARAARVTLDAKEERDVRAL